MKHHTYQRGCCKMGLRSWASCCFLIGLIVLLNEEVGRTKAEEIDFPPLMDSDDVSYFSSAYDIDGLYWALTNIFSRSSRMPDGYMDRSGIRNPLPEILVSRGGGSTYTTEYKLKNDLEQAEYLLKNNKLDIDPVKKSFFENIVVPVLNNTLQRIPSLEELGETGGLYPFENVDYESGIASVYNRALFMPEIEMEGPIINPTIKKEKVYDDWETGGKSGDGHPGVVVIDDILTDEALRKIRDLMMEGTFWYQTKMPHKFGGYVGAYIDDGMHQKILLELAFQLHRALPKIMKDHALKYLWAYKYDSNFTGINTHADQAAVNVNIWLTPDSANMDKSSGGLVVFTAKPPRNWSFEEYNTDTERVLKDILVPTDFANVTISYKANRAVIFDSALFHHTDKFTFREGYENKRINLTLLYGNMKLATTSNQEISEL